jgi:sialic acid synthase SpsE/quercetin dioxygenase-like cupin family protein
MESRIPDKLFVLEMANNHMGDVEHGLRIIREFAAVCGEFPFNFAFKFQYRFLDTFIHPDFQKRTDIKYIKRFTETRLKPKDMLRLIAEVKAQGFKSMCTPFDEVSVKQVVEDNFDIVKVGSCSFTDWPLLEQIALVDKPIVLSTAGASLDEIDNVVAFMTHNTKDFALMHCIAEYPTAQSNMHLNQIDFLRSRYPQLRVGFSTHENPDEAIAVSMAIAKGCTIFEKHVGLSTERYSLNDYSATPQQVCKWLSSAQHAFEMLGTGGERLEASEQEKSTLHSLRRGVFAKREIAVGESLSAHDVYMAIPTQEGQITANDWSKYSRFIATLPIPTGTALLGSNTCKKNVRETILSIILQVHKMLELGNIVIPSGAMLEISHHYGLEKFHEYGATLITVINREYCKKVLVVLPGQKHPNHYHKKKDETLHVLHGTLNVTLGEVTRDYLAGEMVVVEPGMHHSFTSKNGAVFEEISSTHYINDSVYTDPAINENVERKTVVNHWYKVTQFDLEKGLKQLAATF